MKTAGYTGNYPLWSTPVIPFAEGLQHLPGNRAYKPRNPISWSLEIGILSSVYGKAPTRYFSELLLPGQFCPVTIDHNYVATDEGYLTT